MAKDFTSASTKAVYNHIAEATQEVKTPRRTYTEKEAAAMREARATQGRKGCAMARINIAMPDSMLEYVRTMARAEGVSMTQFVQQVLDQHMEANKEEYRAILNLRKRFGRK